MNLKDNWIIPTPFFKKLGNIIRENYVNYCYS